MKNLSKTVGGLVRDSMYLFISSSVLRIPGLALGTQEWGVLRLMIRWNEARGGS